MVRFLFCLLSSLVWNSLSYSQSLVWAKDFQDCAYLDPKIVKSDNLGNVYHCGNFYLTCDFDAGPEVDSLAATDIGFHFDVYISKHDAAGNYLWTITCGESDDNQIINALEIAEDGTIFITGYYYNTVDFDPGEGVHELTSNGYEDIFFASYNTDGELNWAYGFGSNDSPEKGIAILILQSGDVLLTGHYRDDVDFDPGPGVFYLPSNNFTNLFLVKFSAGGEFIWGKSIQGNAPTITDMLETNDGGIFATGNFFLSMDFDWSEDVDIMNGNGFNNSYYWKFSQDGTTIWRERIASMDDAFGKTVAKDSLGFLYCFGAYYGELILDGNTNFNQPQYGDERSMYLIKLDEAGEIVWASSAGGAEGLDVDELVVKSNEEIYLTTTLHGDSQFQMMGDTITFDLTDDNASSVVLLKFNSEGEMLFNASIGNEPGFNSSKSMFVDEEYIYMLGTYADTVDVDPSMDTLNLFSADSYTDYLLKLTECGEVSSSAVEIHACSEFVSQTTSQAWTESGTYYELFENTLGCDSLVTIDLDITSLDTTLILTGSTLQAAMDGAEYQWINCTTASVIPGENSQVFSPEATGDYALILAYDGCSDTTQCTSITIIDISEMPLFDGIRVFPNPASDFLNMDIPEQWLGSEVTISDSAGRTVFQTRASSSSMKCDLDSLNSGIYFLEIYTEGSQACFRLIKD